ncbi:uncharacterized protein LOC101457294 [Ceratitis capitata]|uniref:uncharacterized protein LOC101457294 n=1 Tax=Ceratitis capitata TaxID=7213 RepID=UPI000329CEB5|nr:uncharacterized protein LOC101457294 [Ceratitis capitata]
MHKVKNIYNKYFFKNGKAFTEDYVVVRRIRVTYITNVAEYDLRKYFRKFGAFEQFEITDESETDRYKKLYTCYICFVEPEAACRALLIENHLVDKKRIFVEPVHSWQQPDKDKACNPMAEGQEEHENVVDPKAALNILKLPEYCIEAILEQMKPGDQIRLSRTHKGFRYIFEAFCRREIKKFDLDEMRTMTLWEIRDFLEITGKYLVKISGSINHKFREEIVDLLSKHCTNLKSVTLKDMIGMKAECLNNFLRLLPDLQELNVTRCAMNDKSIKILTAKKKLHSLHLYDVAKITGAQFKHLLQLEHLSLHDCYQVLEQNIRCICKSLTNLRTLDIRGIDLELCPNFFQEMSTLCQKLEVLKTTAIDDKNENVALLPGLKHLEIVYSQPNKRLTVLPKLVQHKANQLEILKIYSRQCLTVEHIKKISRLAKLKTLSIAFSGDALSNLGLAQLGQLKQLEDLTIAGSDKVTNEGLLGLLRTCPKLHTLNIQFCKQITNDFLTEVIYMARFRGRKFTISTYGTSVVESAIVECPSYQYVTRRSLLDVEFEFKEVGLEDFEDVFVPTESL